MNWITDRNPAQSQPYLVSIVMQKTHARHGFTYVAYYEVDTNTWYKYNPFLENYKPEEPVEGTVTAWSEGIGVFLN